MDEHSLSYALECSVCLNTLDEDNRVLPCQHTFCTGCLEDIATKRTDLNCPECRIPFRSPISNLPRNILLIRLLEAIKTSRRNSTSQVPLFGGNSTKSCPVSPNFATGSTEFSLRPITPVRKNSLPQETSFPIPSRPIPVILQNDTELPADLQESASSASLSTQSITPSKSGLRISKTAIDLTSLSSALTPEETAFNTSAADGVRSFERKLEPRSACTSSSYQPFTQWNWRSSPRNRSLPGNNPSQAERRMGDGRDSPFGTETSTVALPQRPAYEFLFQTKVTPDGGMVLQRTTEVNSGAPKDGMSFINKLFRSNGRSNEFRPNAAAPAEKQRTSAYSGNYMINGSSLDSHFLDADTKNKKVTAFNALRHHKSQSKPTTFECYRCVVPYSAKNSYELELRLNDLLYVHQKRPDGWMKATHERTGRNGLVPVAFVERLHGNVSAH